MISSNICSRLFCSACDDECEVFEICKYFYNLEWNPQLICMYVCDVCMHCYCLSPRCSIPENTKFSLSCFTYLCGLSHASRASRISSSLSLLLLFNIEEAFWLLLFFPILISLKLAVSETGTRKKGRNEKSRLAVATTSTSHTFR